MNHWIVYKYTFPDGKCYIGATKRSLYARQGSHFQRYKGCKALWAAIQNYGVENIRQEILFEGDCEDSKAAELEKQYILLFDSQNPEHGYNTYGGGEGLKKNLSVERKEQLRKLASVLWEQRRGSHPDEETRRRQSIAKKGKKKGPLPDEVKRKISIANSRENMSEETHIRRCNASRKKVLMTNLLTGEQIIFVSQEEVAKFFGVRDSAVSRWINGKRPMPKNYRLERYTPTTTESSEAV